MYSTTATVRKSRVANLVSNCLKKLVLFQEHRIDTFGALFGYSYLQLTIFASQGVRFTTFT